MASLPGVVAALFMTASPAPAQVLGNFSWQLQPFCNVVQVRVEQAGGVYTLDGFDDQCGAPQRAPLVGLAAPNPDGSIGLVFNIVTVPSGRPVHVEARIALATLGGPWTDSAGNGGTVAFGTATGGSPRPAPTVSGATLAPGTVQGASLANGSVGAAQANLTELQARVYGTCDAGRFVHSVNPNGTVNCWNGTASATSSAVGDSALAGLTTGALNVAVGSDALRTVTSRSRNTAVGARALEFNDDYDSTALGYSALRFSTGGANTALGSSALFANTDGYGNTAVGADAMATLQDGSLNTAIGAESEVSSNLLIDATAIGARASVSQSHALVLGGIKGLNDATDDVRVGIGITAPQARLHVTNENQDPAVTLRTDLFADQSPAAGVQWVVGKARGMRYSPAAVAANDSLFDLDIRGYNGSTFGNGASLGAAATQAWTTTAHGTRLQFSTTANGTTTPAARVTIDHDGQVGIGTASPNDALQVAGEVRVSSCVRNFFGTQIAGSCPSDERFKRDITPFDPVLDKVARLRPVHYFWRREAFPEQAWGAGRVAGLVAQEVEAVLPELVTTMPDGYKAVDYSTLPLMLLQALRELKAQQDATAAVAVRLHQDNVELRAEQHRLAQRLAEMETAQAAARRH